MRVTILASGSGGNAAVLEANDGRALLIDAGIGGRAIAGRFERVTGRPLPTLEGLFLTHAHGDHSGCADAVARKFGIPLYLTQASRRGLHLSGETRTRVFGPRTPFDVGPFELRPWPVPHDAPQVCVVVVVDGLQLGLVTDAGQVTAPMRSHLAACDVLLCESNHDPQMLECGPYPEALKRRIASGRGHLDNAAAADLLAAVAPKVAVLMHLSRTNNRPELARSHARAALPERTMLHVASQDEPLHLDLRELAARVSAGAAGCQDAHGVGGGEARRARQLAMF